MSENTTLRADRRASARVSPDRRAAAVAVERNVARAFARTAARALAVGAIILAAAAPVGAMTVAVAVHDVETRDDSAALLASVEEGIMDAFFVGGHIVFDLVIDPEQGARDRLIRAITDARLGGASFVVLVAVTFESTSERGLIPGTLRVTVIDVESGGSLVAPAYRSSQIHNFRELTPHGLAVALGAEAAASALRELPKVAGL